MFDTQVLLVIYIVFMQPYCVDQVEFQM
eukprot:SAG31_NODE_22566_length_522_cov_3.789598_1_plen_27_part_10